MGLIIVASTIKDVWDKNGYLESLGKPAKWFCLKVKPKLIGAGVRDSRGKASAWSGNQRLNCTKSRQTRFSSSLPTVW
jgi:hypothetical protein